MNAVLLAISVYTVLNLLVMSVYFIDKRKAVDGKWRIKETTLLFLGFLGAWGAVAGMKLFHHKTQKPKFKLNYVFLLLHLIGIVGLVTFYYA